MDTDDPVIEHYTRGDIEERIFAALRAAGKNPDHLVPEDLSAVDQFHIGGLEATRALARGAGISGSSYVLDIGSGLGGPARVFAHEFGATVHGVDLTPEFVRVAAALTERTGLAGLVTFSEGDAVSLEYEAGTFDVATLLHVGMNIEHKRELFATVGRLVKPGGIFALYEVMRMKDGELPFPLPWATAAEHSFVATPMDYSNALEEARFEVDSERNDREGAIAFLEAAAARSGASGPPPLGLQTAMGPDIGPRMKNLLGAFRDGLLAPVEIYSHRSN